MPAFSLQRILGEDDAFCRLLQASAQEASNSVVALKRVLTDRSTPASLEAFATARRKNKQSNNQIADLIIRAFVTAMEREDIEALADTLYKIPKTVEKFAERFIISSAVYLLAAPFGISMWSVAATRPSVG